MGGLLGFKVKGVGRQGRLYLIRNMRVPCLTNQKTGSGKGEGLPGKLEGSNSVSCHLFC